MKTFYSILFLILVQSCFSQGFRPPAHNFTPRDYGVAQPPENYSITMDERGFIYSGNVGGVLEYDGFEWNLIKVKTGVPISRVKYAGKNRIAVGGLNLIGIIEPNEKGKLIFQSLVSKIKARDKDFGEIITIENTQDEIIFQTEKCLFIYRNNELKTVYPSTTFFRGVMANNRYFVRERGVGLMELNNNGLKLFSNDSICKDIGFFGLLNYDNDYFLGATYDLGFYLIDKKNGKVLSFQSSFVDEYAPAIVGIEKLSNEDFALATLNYGVVILDNDLQLKNRIAKREGLRTSKINQICIDKFQNIWAATNEGISWMDIYSPLHNFDEQSGISGNVESVIYLGGVYYGGTSTGLFALKSFNENNQVWDKTPIVNSAVYSLDQNGKDVLVASNNGLFRGTLSSFWKMKEGNYHSVKFIAGQNKIVAVTADKIEIFDNNYNLLEEIYLENRYSRILNIVYDTTFKDFTRVWIGLTQGQGIIKLDLNKIGKSNVTVYDEMDGLMKGEVRPLATTHGVLFLTNSGIQKFIPEEEIIKTLSENQKNDPSFYRGYFDLFELGSKSLKGVVTAMAFANERIYVCLNDKVGYYDDKLNFKTLEFSNLNIGRINSFFVDGHDVWISGAEGVVRYHPHHSKNINQKFDVFVKSIKFKNDEINAIGIANGKDPEARKISYDNNSLSFVFSTNYFNPDEVLKFSYYLEGVDENWSAWTEENKIKLNNLHEGEYKLRVKAMNSYGVVSNETVFSFTIFPPWYRTTWAYILYFLLIILVIYLSIRIASYRLKQNNIRLEKTVQERTQEIATKNSELKHQNHQISHQKQEITDSINYAKRIQEAILPLLENFKRVFPDSFILFKPKDIVSGDFYWFAHQDNHSIFICADCTGHGVPGAFMSMICTDRINHTVLEKKITTPSAMLTEVNRGIKRSLKQEDETTLKTKDGMDAAFCSFNHNTNILKYAGANRPLWLLRKGEIIEYKPTKMAVGGFTPEEQIFEEIEIKIEIGDIVYLSTDGYADQFGGPKGKKLMVKAFKELLIENAHLDFQEQKELLDKHIENWRTTKQLDGNEIEQVDDMCVIGIRF